MESSPILLACVLSGLVATSLSLSCIECRGEDDKPCQGTPTQCSPDADSCVSTYALYSDGTAEVKYYSRYCGTRQNCSLTGSFSSTAGTIKISSSCCFTSNCAPSVPAFPADKTDKNGVSCMDCQGPADMPCTSSTYRACTGDENKCVIMTQSPEKSLSGCGMSALCDAKVMDKTGEQPVQFKCTSGGSGLQSGMLVLLSVSLLLAKVIG